ncbi:MAG: Thymidylate kinase [Syntrophomonadaceae bacterium]|nr:Thymidylate kinase [Bacillota bacterium]
MKGMLVTFEGQDGSGKSTLLHLVDAELRQRGFSVVVVPEFSNRVVGKFLQETLTQNKFLRLNTFGPSALTETMYVLSDLYSQDEFEIVPAFRDGAIVVKERHVDSILACQLPKIAEDYPQSNAEQIFQWLRQTCNQLTQPDLTVFLRVSDETLHRRIEARGEQVAESDFAVFRKRQEIYDRLAVENSGRWFEIVNDGEPQDAVQTVVEQVMRRTAAH